MAHKQIAQTTIQLLKSDLDSKKAELITLYNQIVYNENQNENFLKQLRDSVVNSNKYQGVRERDIGYFLLSQRTQMRKSNIENEYAQNLAKLELYYKQAYSLIHKIREYFYEPITYHFGFTIDGSYYETILTKDQLLNITAIQMQSRTTQFDKLYGLRIQAGRQVLESLRSSAQEIKGEKLALLTRTLDKKTYKKSVNIGQRYEAYVDLATSQKEEITNRQLEKALRESRKNNLSWVRGGDVGTTQVKFMDASLTSATTLINTMEALIKALEISGTDGNLLKMEMVKIFGPNSQFGSYIEEKASKALKREMHRELSSIPNIEIKT